MNLLDCEYPKRVFNRYSQEWHYVSCGKCNTCLKKRANKWIERLNVERKCWKYCLFYTLTYAPEYVPYLRKKDSYLVDLSHKHQGKDKDCPMINLVDLRARCTREEWSKIEGLLTTYSTGVPYLSIYDSQLFIKRLRKNIKNDVTRKFKDVEKSDYQVRYYHIGEFGPTTFRPHYHGLLFFSSEKEAACIEEALHKSWKFGIVDTSFVAECNAAYLAKYLNCNANLPKVFEDRSIAPFAIFSKSVPLGSLYFDSQDIRKIYDQASPKMLVDYVKGLSLEYVPLWRVHKDRLFPKLAFFSHLTHYDRTKLYRTYEYFEENFLDISALSFANYVLERYENYECNKLAPSFGSSFLHVYYDYMHFAFDFLDNDKQRINFLVRWFLISSRVVHQSRVFGVTVDSYVSQIELFYENCQKENLVSQLNFEQEYLEKYGSSALPSLLGLDLEFLNSVLDVPLDLMTAQEIMILESFGVDIEKFTSQDLSEKLSYQDLILPQNQLDYIGLLIDGASYMRKHTKSKLKNDYLMSHPEFNSLLH